MQQDRQPDGAADGPPSPTGPDDPLDAVPTEDRSLDARVARQRELIAVLRRTVAVQRSWLEAQRDRLDDVEARLAALESLESDDTEN